MLPLREHAHEPLEYGLKAKLDIERCEIGQVWLGTDHPYQFRNQVREQTTVGSDRLENAIAPTRDFGRFSIQDLADQSLECLGHSCVGDVAAALIKLAGDEDASRKDDHFVQFVDYRRFADSGIARHKHDLRFAAVGHSIEGRQQCRYLTLASVNALRYKQAIRRIARRKREWLDPAGLFQRGKTCPQVGLEAGSSLVSVFRGLGEQLHHN